MNPDLVIARIAERQHRIVTRRQLLDAGLSAARIRNRLETGRLFRLHPGVYSVGTADPGPLGHLLSAVFASGDLAVLSHRSAAVLWRLLDAKPGPIDVTVPGTKPSSPRLVRADPQGDKWHGEDPRTPGRERSVDTRDKSARDRAQEAKRYRRAAELALDQLQWAVNYLYRIRKPALANALNRNRERILAQLRSEP